MRLDCGFRFIPFHISYPLLIFFIQREEAFDNGKRFAEEVGCYAKDEIWNGESVLTCLLGKSTREIFNAQVSG